MISTQLSVVFAESRGQLRGDAQRRQDLAAQPDKADGADGHRPAARAPRQEARARDHQVRWSQAVNTEVDQITSCPTSVNSGTETGVRGDRRESGSTRRSRFSPLSGDRTLIGRP